MNELPGIALSRITPPRPTETFLLRKELISRIDSSGTNSNYLIAPSGYGKSVLASQWAETKKGNVAWYTMAPSDGPRNIIFYVASAIRMTHPKFAPWIENLINKDFDFLDASTRITNELTKLTTPPFLILENTDVLGTDGEFLINTLHNNIPSNIQFLSTRRELPSNSREFTLNLSNLNILTTDELAFSNSELESLCASQGIDFKDIRVRKILESQKGWPAGIQITANTIATRGVESIPDLPGENLATKLAFEGLNEDEAKIFLELSLLESATAESAENITKNILAGELLNEMAKKGQYISRSSDAIPEYILNPILREYLKSILVKDKIRYQEISNTTALELIRTEKSLAAVEIYMNAGLHELAFKLLSQHMDMLFYSANFELLMRCTPTYINSKNKDENFGVLLRAYANLSMGNIEEAKKYRSVLASSAQLTEELILELSILNNWINFENGDYFECIKSWQNFNLNDFLIQNSENTRLPYILRPFIMASFMVDEDDVSLEIWNVIKPIIGSHNPLIKNIFVPSVQAIVKFNEGNFKEANELAQFVLFHAKQLGLSGIHIPFECAYIVVAALQEAGNIENAKDIAYEYLHLAENFNQISWFQALAGKIGQIHFVQGLVQEGKEIFRNAHTLISKGQYAEYIDYTLTLLEIVSLHSVKDYLRIEDYFAKLPENSTKKRLQVGYASMSKDKTTESEILKMETRTVHEEVIQKIYLAQANIDNQGKALDYLREAVRLASASGYLRGFLTYSEEIKGLLLALASQTPTIYLDNLAKAIQSQSLNIQAYSKNESNLTVRELDILRRLATGQPISKLAGQLHISKNTMKTHLRNVYKKLNADSRTSAVVRGRELGII